MAVIIAGREVKKGDSLWHSGYQAWGTVTGFDTNAAMLRVANGGSEVTVYVSSGGIAGGKRRVWWHEPVQLDLAVQDIGPVQRIVEAFLKEMY